MPLISTLISFSSPRVAHPLRLFPDRLERGGAPVPVLHAEHLLLAALHDRHLKRLVYALPVEVVPDDLRTRLELPHLFGGQFISETKTFDKQKS